MSHKNIIQIHDTPYTEVHQHKISQTMVVKHLQQRSIVAASATMLNLITNES